MMRARLVYQTCRQQLRRWLITMVLPRVRRGCGTTCGDAGTSAGVAG